MNREEKISLVREGLDAYERGDMEALFALMDPEIEIHNEPEGGNAGTYRGHQGWLEWNSLWVDAWSEISYEPQEFIDAGDGLVVKTFLRARGRGSGVPVEMHFYWVFDFREGKLSRWDLYVDRNRALAAAGVDD